VILWNILRQSKPATFATVLKTAAVANARHPASPLAKQAAVSQISSAKKRVNNC